VRVATGRAELAVHIRRASSILHARTRTAVGTRAERRHHQQGREPCVHDSDTRTNAGPLRHDQTPEKRAPYRSLTVRIVRRIDFSCSPAWRRVPGVLVPQRKIGRQRSETRDPRAEVRARRFKPGDPRTEIQEPRSKNRDPRPEILSRVADSPHEPGIDSYWRRPGLGPDENFTFHSSTIQTLVAHRSAASR
jgi:hypothetical protein